MMMRARHLAHRPEIVRFAHELWVQCRTCGRVWPCWPWRDWHTAKQITRQERWAIRACNRRRDLTEPP